MATPSIADLVKQLNTIMPKERKEYKRLTNFPSEQGVFVVFLAKTNYDCTVDFIYFTNTVERGLFCLGPYPLGGKIQGMLSNINIMNPTKRKIFPHESVEEYKAQWKSEDDLRTVFKQRRLLMEKQKNIKMHTSVRSDYRVWCVIQFFPNGLGKDLLFFLAGMTGETTPTEPSEIDGFVVFEDDDNAHLHCIIEISYQDSFECSLNFFQIPYTEYFDHMLWHSHPRYKAQIVTDLASAVSHYNELETKSSSRIHEFGKQLDLQSNGWMNFTDMGLPIPFSPRKLTRNQYNDLKEWSKNEMVQELDSEIKLSNIFPKLSAHISDESTGIANTTFSHVVSMGKYFLRTAGQDCSICWITIEPDYKFNPDGMEHDLSSVFTRFNSNFPEADDSLKTTSPDQHTPQLLAKQMVYVLKQFYLRFADKGRPHGVVISLEPSTQKWQGIKLCHGVMVCLIRTPRNGDGLRQKINEFLSPSGYRVKVIDSRHLAKSHNVPLGPNDYRRSQRNSVSIFPALTLLEILYILFYNFKWSYLFHDRLDWRDWADWLAEIQLPVTPTLVAYAQFGQNALSQILLSKDFDAGDRAYAISKLEGVSSQPQYSQDSYASSQNTRTKSSTSPRRPLSQLSVEEELSDRLVYQSIPEVEVIEI